MPPNRFESEVESFLEGSHGDRTHIKRADHPRLHHYAGRYLGVRRAWWRIRIGTTHLDRLLRYPDVRNLSGCSSPIRVFASHARGS